VTSCPNAVLHAWLKEQICEILAGLPAPGLLPNTVAGATTNVRRAARPGAFGHGVQPRGRDVGSEHHCQPARAT
jgi:hypothetical protein